MIFLNKYKNLNITHRTYNIIKFAKKFFTKLKHIIKQIIIDKYLLTTHMYIISKLFMYFRSTPKLNKMVPIFAVERNFLFIRD